MSTLGVVHHPVMRERVLLVLLILALAGCWLVVLVGSAALVVWGP